MSEKQSGVHNRILSLTNNKLTETKIKYNEIKQYINTRYVCSPEAMDRLLEYNMYELSHVIYRLPVHNENEQNIYFIDGCENEVIDQNLSTPLTAWFELNQT